MTTINQKNIPAIINGERSGSSSFVRIADTGGINAKMKNEKNRATINNGTHEIPHALGPNGFIHNWPDHVAKNTTTKNSQKPRIGFFVIAEIINTKITVIIKAAGIIE